MENSIYWQGKMVGIECGSHVSWFPSVSPEAIAVLTGADITPSQDDRKDLLFGDGAPAANK